MWSHWPSLLVALIDPELPSLPAGWDSCLQKSGISLDTVASGELDSRKGVEYQHAIVIMGSKLFVQLEEGFEGSGRTVYAQRRRLRIPFSRAKDSVVVMVPA